MHSCITLALVDQQHSEAPKKAQSKLKIQTSPERIPSCVLHLALHACCLKLLVAGALIHARWRLNLPFPC